MATCSRRCLFPLLNPRCAMACQMTPQHSGYCVCLLHFDDRYAPAEVESVVVNDIEGNNPGTSWESVQDLVMVFTAVGVDAKKAVKLWRHGVRSTSRLASLSAWEEEMAGIVNIDKERLHQFLEARPLGHRSRSLPLRSDHPIISPTLRGTRVGTKLALRTPAGRAAALEGIDNLVDAPSARNNASQRWNTWCELLEPFGERPLPLLLIKLVCWLHVYRKAASVPPSPTSVLRASSTSRPMACALAAWALSQ